jgi:integrase
VIQYVFLPIRHDRAASRSRAEYIGRYKMPGMKKPATVRLRVTDKRIAEQRLMEIVREAENEAAGIVMPKPIRSAAVLPFVQHLDAFVTDLRARGRSKMYVRNVAMNVKHLIASCGWGMVKDVTPQSFMVWRAGQSKAAKTINEYLNAANALLNWMHRTGLLLANPLLCVGKVETQGKERRLRRALTDAEVQRLLDVNPRHRVVYMTALLTGLRRAELKALRWGDFHLDAVRPFVNVRASTTKNHKAATMFLREDLVDALRAMRPVGVSDVTRVFWRCIPRMPEYRSDLAKAGIDFEDTQGRRVDFHALRHTLATNLSRSGVAPRVAMELMRHSDMRLTARTYTDASLLPMSDALEKLPRFNAVEEVLSATRTDGNGSAKIDAQIDAQSGVCSGRGESQAVTPSDHCGSAKGGKNSEKSHALTPAVTVSHEGKKSSATRIRT